MVWFLVWVVLVLAAAAVFFLLGRDLWRKGRALTREIGEAADRLTAVSDQLAAVSDRLAELDRGEPPAGAPLGDVRSESSSPRPRR